MIIALIAVLAQLMTCTPHLGGFHCDPLDCSKARNGEMDCVPRAAPTPTPLHAGRFTYESCPEYALMEANIPDPDEDCFGQERLAALIAAGADTDEYEAVERRFDWKCWPPFMLNRAGVK